MEFEKYLEPLNAIIPLKQQVSGLNQALKNDYPIAIVVDKHFLIYDIDSAQTSYQFKKQAPLPMPVPEGVRAAFQLEAYGGRIACVVTPDVFDSQDGYITLLHEFVHCYQYETCEQDLKMTLDVACHAQEKGDFMWEIQHPFPYCAEDFVQPYTQFLKALAVGDEAQVNRSRRNLRVYLGVHDYEYMVWQEWKEGFARWMENKIKMYLGMPENKGGLGAPYSRVVFYAGGEAYIAYLAKSEPDLTADLPALFHRMLAVPTGESS